MFNLNGYVNKTYLSTDVKHPSEINLNRIWMASKLENNYGSLEKQLLSRGAAAASEQEDAELLQTVS